MVKYIYWYVYIKKKSLLSFWVFALQYPQLSSRNNIYYTIVAVESAGRIYLCLEVCRNSEFLFLWWQSGKLRGMEKMKFRTYRNVNVGSVWKLSSLNVPLSTIINSSLHLYSTFRLEALSCMRTIHAGIISHLWNEEVIEGFPGVQRRGVIFVP